MHDKFNFLDIVHDLSDESLKKLLEFRVKFLEEELNEIKSNMDNPEEIVDGLIDLCVVAIGTMDMFDIDSYEAWNKVLESNLAKKAGIKPERPNPLGLPDLMKPEGWAAPDHAENHGSLTRACK